MLRKSDLYWHVIPKPSSLQNPVSFFITYQKNAFRVMDQHFLYMFTYFGHVILSIHFTTNLPRRRICHVQQNIPVQWEEQQRVGHKHRQDCTG